MLKSLQIGLLGLGGILASIFLSPIALSQPANFPKEFYRLQTQFTGKNKCLDIVNDGNNNQLTMQTVETILDSSGVLNLLEIEGLTVCRHSLQAKISV